LEAQVARRFGAEDFPEIFVDGRVVINDENPGL
jgi:hypothetical protein